MPGHLGHATKFLRSSGGETPTFSEIGDVIAITPPSLSRDSVETTPHGTPDRYRRFIPGLRDGGEVEIQLQYDPAAAGQTDLIDDFNDDTVHDYRIDLPTDIGESWSFSGFLTALGDETPIDDRMTRSVTIKIDGKPELATTPA